MTPGDAGADGGSYLQDLYIFAASLYHNGEFRRLINVLNNNVDIVERSNKLKLLCAQALIATK